jgi:1-acyl-sn-glycerol-3-phosphate acyltransferase
LRKAWRLLRIIPTLALYFSLAPFGYSVLALMSTLPARDADARARRLQGVMHRAFRLMHDWLRGLGIIDFNPRKIEGFLPDGPCVLVANHRTLTDITSIVASLGPMTTVVKSEIYQMWWLRPLLAGAGLIEGPTNNQLGAASVVRSAVRHTQNGSRFVFFPEGTRAPDDHLLPFGRTAFEVACRADVPVVPLLLHWEHPWLSKDCRLFQMPTGPTQLRLELLSPVYPRDFQGSSRALRDMVETTFRTHLDRDSGGGLEGGSDAIYRRSAQASHR